MNRSLVFASIACAVACGSGRSTQSPSQVQARAAFDFNCPANQVRIGRLDDRSRTATGCGQRAVYVRLCDQCATFAGYTTECNCTWVLDAARRSAPGGAPTFGAPPWYGQPPLMTPPPTPPPPVPPVAPSPMLPPI